MCDTQVMVTDDAVWMAKNSDREPAEPQPVVRLDAVRGDAAPTVRTTYLDIAQVPDRHAVTLSQPVWCWGAEMGVNEHGVAIGNEAVFSRRAGLRPALLGMDLVRLGLERASDAEAALSVMTTLLEKYGQGGAAGYADKRFCYDSSFIVADPRQAWVLETAGRSWAARRVHDRDAISNRLTLQRDYDRCSDDLAERRPDFAQQFDTRLMPFFACARQRRDLSLSRLDAMGAPSFAGFAGALRAHHGGHESPRRGSNRDVCMHATGFVRRHQTTGSMIVRLSARGSQAAFTGTSAPCLSIFRPAAFHGGWSVLTPPQRFADAPLWYAHEAVHRAALFDDELRGMLHGTRDETEARIFELMQDGDVAALEHADRLAAAWQAVMLREATRRPLKLSAFWSRLSRTEGTLN